MSSEHSRGSADISIHIPIAILSVAVAIYFGVQLRNTSKQSDIMRWQLGNLDKQAETLSKAPAQFAEKLTESDDAVKQAEQVQGPYVNLFNDLLDLAKDDKDAKEVVEKLGIKRNEAPKTEDGAAKDSSEPAKKDK